MIFGNVNNLEEYSFLDEKIKACFTYANAHYLKGFTKGCHAIDGDRFFVNVVEYKTTTPENRFWEAHKKYLDIHFMLEGEEQIDVNFLNNMSVKGFVEEDDFVPMDGEKNGSVILREGDFLICYPMDAHRTAVQVDQPQQIKKAIFKILIEE